MDADSWWVPRLQVDRERGMRHSRGGTSLSHRNMWKPWRLGSLPGRPRPPQLVASLCARAFTSHR